MTFTYIFDAKTREIIYLQLDRRYQQFQVKMANYYLYRCGLECSTEIIVTHRKYVKAKQ